MVQLPLTVLLLPPIVMASLLHGMALPLHLVQRPTGHGQEQAVVQMAAFIIQVLEPPQYLVIAKLQEPWRFQMAVL